MKFKLLPLVMLVILTSCKNSSTDKVKGAISNYIKSKVKNSNSYRSIYFSQIDTTNEAIYQDSFMQQYKPDYKYSVTHVYEIENSDKEKINMTIDFHFDTTFKIIGISLDGLNGDYGQFTGNIYWKYNDYIGNKPDAGSKAILYSTDTLRKDLKYEATCDVQGNFKFDRVLTGNYLLIVNSRNTTNSPDDKLDELLLRSGYLEQLFGYNIYKENEADIKQYWVLDSIYRKTLYSDAKDGFSSKYTTYHKIEKQKMDLAEKIIDKFPKSFCTKIGIYGAYSQKIKIKTETVDEGKTTNEVIDFGITYF